MFPGIVPFVIPSLPYVERVADALAATSVRVGVQNVHWAEEGAFTGEVSARMAAEVGATIAEIGPSERRAMFGETDETVRARTKAALAAGLTPVVCIGAAGRRMMRARPPRRSSGRQRWLCPGSRPTKRGVVSWLTNPCGRSAMTLLYGGSVSLDNVRALSVTPHVDGLFVGRVA
jgi:triosephosphate isomerase